MPSPSFNINSACVNFRHEMSQQIPLDILSDSDSDTKLHRRRSLEEDTIDLTTPPPFPNSKMKLCAEILPNPINSTVFIVDDDPTPIKKKSYFMGPPASSSTPSFVPETPFSDTPIVKCSYSMGPASTPTPFVAETPWSDASIVKYSARKCSPGSAAEQLIVADAPESELFKSEVSTVKCNSGDPKCEPACSSISNHNPAVSDIKGLICVDSDNESERIDVFGTELGSRRIVSSYFLNTGTSMEIQTKLFMGSADETHNLDGCSPSPSFLEDEMSQKCNQSDNETNKVESVDQITRQPSSGGLRKKKTKDDEAMKPKRISEEKLRMMEEKKQQKEREKLLKAASKAEAAEMRKRQKEMQKWGKGKYALKSIVAEIDRKVVEFGSIGGNLLTRFAEKGLSYRITSNPVEGSILWTMAVPEEISVTSAERIEISYMLIIYEAEEFCYIVADGSLMNHVQSVRSRYPHHTICYLTNRLMAYMNKREQAQYKNPANCTGWKRPAIEEVLSKLATHFLRVHSRQCVDESELAEHVVGLTCSLASCQFRKKLTRLSVNANGTAIPKDCVDKNLIKKSLWLKALVAIPKVQPRFAIAIGKKYPTMKSLLTVYMDPTKSVHEKEFLLKDLNTEGLLGDDRRLGEVCSKRIYRILMAQSGTILTDQVENGADFFSHQSS